VNQGSDICLKSLLIHNPCRSGSCIITVFTGGNITNPFRFQSDACRLVRHVSVRRTTPAKDKPRLRQRLFQSDTLPDLDRCCFLWHRHDRPDAPIPQGYCGDHKYFRLFPNVRSSSSLNYKPCVCQFQKNITRFSPRSCVGTRDL